VSAPTPEIRAFQIFYDEKTRASLDRDFEPLDNTDSERADWYEYWPIRNWLSRNELNESSYYGFLSPRFGEKTRLSGAQVKEFVRTAGDPDVVTFSPVPCHAASNFFLAKRAFWEAWKVVFDRLFEMAESPGFPLHDSLNRELEYAKDNGETSSTHMKIFVMERAASFVLASGKFRVRNFPPFQIPVCNVFSGRLADIVALDSLKIAYSETEEPDYLMLYMQMRDEALASTWLKSAGSKGALAQSRG
jgi:hypothetical protein